MADVKISQLSTKTDLATTNYIPISDNTTTTKIGTDSLFGFRNKIINGDMRIDQRNAGAALVVNPPSTAVYSLDRWGVRITNSNTASPNSLYAQRVAGDISSPYAIRLSKISGTSTGQIAILQPFESIESTPLAGKTVTLSFRARKGSSFTGAGINSTATPSVQIFSGTGTDQTLEQAYQAGWANQNYFYNTNTGSVLNGTLTTSFSLFIATGVVPSNATQIGVQIGTGLFSSATGDSNNYLDIADVQLEVGSTATPFERRPVGLELALCQRYYINYDAGPGPLGALYLGAHFLNGNTQTTSVSFPVTMRTSPTPGWGTLAGVWWNGTNSSQLNATSPFSLIITSPMNFQIGTTGNPGNISPAIIRLYGACNFSAEL